MYRMKFYWYTKKNWIMSFVGKLEVIMLSEMSYTKSESVSWKLKILYVKTEN